MKNSRRFLAYVIYAVLGCALIILGCLKVLDSFWSGMGCALLVIGIMRVIGHIRYNKNPEYREKIKIANSDERNKFIRGRAWAWTGYIYILSSAVAVIVLRVMGQELLSMAVCCALCFMLVVYWCIYLLLNKKY